MITYSALVSRPKLFARLLGHTPKEFDAIFDKFKSAYEEKLRLKELGPTRKRKLGAGRHSHLVSLEDKLVFILLYVRQYPLEFIQGMFFNLSESNACFWIHELLPTLDKSLDYAHAKPNRHQSKGLEEILAEFPELIEMGILGDGTERPRRKPKNKQARVDDYSGKKKRHTRKNVILSHPKSNRILYLGKTQSGSVHDKKALDEEHLSAKGVRKKILLGVDLGLEGVEIPGCHLVLPRKKPKGKELSETDKSQNQAFSAIRVRVEHALSGVKRSHAVADTYRNIKTGTDDLLMSVACGLHNVRVAYRYQTG